MILESKRFALWLLSSILLLLALLVAAAGYLLGTEAGTASTLNWLQSISGGLVKVEHSQGHLLGRLELADLTIDWGSGEIQIKQLVFDWSPRTLLRQEFTINELVASQLRYVGKPEVGEPPPEPLWPIELPRIESPVEIVIRHLEVSNAAIIIAPESTPLLVDKAAAAARWDDTGITLEQLDSTGPNHTLAIRGQLDPMNAYAIWLENRLQILVADDVSFGLQGVIEGNTRRLELDQHISGDARLHLSGTLDQPLADPSWSALL
jgi:translocation and assembly module TamB